TTQPTLGSPLVEVGLGAVDLAVDGARVRFGGDPEVVLQGGIRSELFADADGVRPRIPFVATVATSGGFSLVTDVSALPDRRLPLGVGTFEPVTMGTGPAVAVEASGDAFALVMAGILRLPELSEDFAL